MYIENLEIILWNGKSDQAGRDDMHLNFFDQKNVVGQNGAVATIFETFCVETRLWLGQVYLNSIVFGGLGVVVNNVNIYMIDLCKVSLFEQKINKLYYRLTTLSRIWHERRF